MVRKIYGSGLEVDKIIQKDLEWMKGALFLCGMFMQCRKVSSAEISPSFFHQVGSGILDEITNQACL